MSMSLCVCVSMSLYVYLCVCVCLSRSDFSLVLSSPPFLPPSILYCLPLLSLRDFLSSSISYSLHDCLCLSLSLHVSLSVSLCLSLVVVVDFVSLSRTPSVCLSACLSLSNLFLHNHSSYRCSDYHNPHPHK